MPICFTGLSRICVWQAIRGEGVVGPHATTSSGYRHCVGVCWVAVVARLQEISPAHAFRFVALFSSQKNRGCTSSTHNRRIEFRIIPKGPDHRLTAFASATGTARRKPHYLGGVCSKGSLVYRAFSISITNATLPSGLRNGNGLPVYLSEIGSMYLQSPSGRLSDTRPRSCASL